MRTVAFLLVLASCSGTQTAPAPAEAPAPAAKPSGPVEVGMRMTPITAPLAIPVKGAKLTLVNYFATWCESSKRWMPQVENMRQKYAALGLAVVGVSAADESSQADLERAAKEWGGTFPVSADKDHRIIDTLPPPGWGQTIIVVDAQGLVRLVHRGTRPGDFEKVDAAVGRLLGR